MDRGAHGLFGDGLGRRCRVCGREEGNGRVAVRRRVALQRRRRVPAGGRQVRVRLRPVGSASGGGGGDALGVGEPASAAARRPQLGERAAEEEVGGASEGLRKERRRNGDDMSVSPPGSVFLSFVLEEEPCLSPPTPSPTPTHPQGGSSVVLSDYNITFSTSDTEELFSF